MKRNTCPKCKAELAADLAECPKCGYRFEAKKNHIPTIVGSCLLFLAFAGGLAFNIRSEHRMPEPTPVPQIVETFTPTVPPRPTPAPTPTVDSVEVYAFGRALDADGFTAYVGDKPFTLSAYAQPGVPRPEFTWSIDDSVELSVSPDTQTCEFTVLKPSGKTELTVRCYGAEVTIPVYLWER